MSKKRCSVNKWSIEVYDYERKAITDEAVGGIDLRRGYWIHCKWCNTTLKTTSFSLVSWKCHTKTKTHLVREQKTGDGSSQPQVISCSSQSSVHSLTTSLQESGKVSLGGQSIEDHESLMLVRRDLYKNKQDQARHEKDVNNVINAMTNLITEQQSDLNSLQDKVYDMKHEIQELKKELHIFHCKKTEQKNMRAPQKKIAALTSFTTRHIPESRGFPKKTEGGHNNGAWFRSSGKNSSSNNNKMKRNTSDMDNFEKRFRLTGRG
ncbi:unnamed protein product [Peronospora belbahrii]|uniref:Uncharacterized protein n=1 Tax=Peronospora belbahrii TaxID=622444 RepID=A0AAU9LD63_9STRA|nr:unnamed protein product [Peronospora belbahrii]